jgi:endonuclease/exonuclease/phosphatase family metal-dependent hydrolase
MGLNKPKLSWSAKILLGINLLAVVAILLSLLAPVVNPQTFSVPALLGLFYPILFIINFLFFVWWIIRSRWMFIISLLALLLGWNVFFNHFALNGNNLSDAGSAKLHIASYNVRIFDVHNWRTGENPVIRDSIISFLKKLDADIICFQEFFHGENNYFPTIQPISTVLDTPWIHTDFDISDGRDKHFGLATFSKYPIINKGIINFPGTRANSGIFSDVLIDDDTIRIFNIHLESIKFSNSDYKFVTDIMEPGNNTASSSGKIILSKLKHAFIKRSRQAQTVHIYIEKSPYPVILCGDFNDTPSSFAYQSVNQNLSDAFLESGFGFGSTYAGGIPFLRIDYILHSKKLKSSGFQKYQVHFSDHYPVSVNFEIE